MNKKYSYEEFKSVLSGMIKEKFDNEINIEIHNIIKNNSLELEGMVLYGDKKKISPNFYLQIYYEEYLQGTGIEDIAGLMYNKYIELKDMDYDSFDLGIEKCKDKIVCRLVSFQKNSQLLEEIPYIPFLDLAIIFYCLVIENGNGIGSIRITNSIMDEWGITTKMLYKTAIYNTEKIFPKVFCPLKIMLKNMLENDEALMPGMQDNVKKCILQEEDAPFILTNERGINGAAVILYPGCLKEIGEITGLDLYILPSSIHELLVIPDDGNVYTHELKHMIHEVNESCVVEEEVLSDQLYHYSTEKNIIEICV